MNFIFECSTRYLTSERSERVRYRVEHERIKFISTSGHVIFCLLYKHRINSCEKGAIYYVAITRVISSRVKITYYLHVWRYEVFAGKLTWYFTGVYIIKTYIYAVLRNWNVQMAPKRAEKLSVVRFFLQFTFFFSSDASTPCWWYLLYLILREIRLSR